MSTRTSRLWILPTGHRFLFLKTYAYPQGSFLASGAAICEKSLYSYDIPLAACRKHGSRSSGTARCMVPPGSPYWTPKGCKSDRHGHWPTSVTYAASDVRDTQQASTKSRRRFRCSREGSIVILKRMWQAYVASAILHRRHDEASNLTNHNARRSDRRRMDRGPQCHSEW